MHKTIYVLVLTPILTYYSLDANADPAATSTDGEWRGSIIAGVSVASGNTRSTAANVGADATSATAIDKRHLYLTGLYSTQKDNEGVKTQTANLARGGGRYDHDLDEEIFSFGSLDLEHDKLQQLKLRSVFGLGLGKHVFKTPKTTFDLIAGITYNRERFYEFARDSAELLLGEESTHKISDTSSIKQRLAVYPNIRESGQYRVQFDAGLNTAINSRIGLQITLSDRYQSNPPEGIKNNDVLFLTSVSYKFGPK